MLDGLIFKHGQPDLSQRLSELENLLAGQAQQRSVIVADREHQSLPIDADALRTRRYGRSVWQACSNRCRKSSNAGQSCRSS